MDAYKFDSHTGSDIEKQKKKKMLPLLPLLLLAGAICVGSFLVHRNLETKKVVEIQEMERAALEKAESEAESRNAALEKMESELESRNAALEKAQSEVESKKKAKAKAESEAESEKKAKAKAESEAASEAKAKAESEKAVRAQAESEKAAGEQAEDELERVDAVQTDPALEAAEKYRKAAEAGDTESMVYLGRCYLYGTGVTEDPKEALKWFTRYLKKKSWNSSLMKVMDRTKAVQEVLNSLGYECGTEDGVYDIKTRDAIRRFRTDYGIEVSDGIDIELMQKLLEAAEKS